MLPELLTLIVAAIAFLAECLHLRRVHLVRRLAFGPIARPAAWTWFAPAMRVVGISLACWGFLSLWLVVQARVHDSDAIPENEYKHLVLIVDVSPSMSLKDAGPDGDQTRRQRASDVLESLFNRVPMRQFKISVIAVYTDAKPMLEDSTDHEVVRHIMEKMPMWHAFKPGKTKLIEGVTQAMKTAKPWNPGSTYVLMLTDGDFIPSTGMPRRPASVNEFVVVGVGNPNSGTFIHDHQSRQDVNALRQLANRMKGVYHNGNQKHLTSQVVAKFLESHDDQSKDPWTRREWALLAALCGSALYCLVPILLHYFGTSYQGGKLVGSR